MNSARTLKTMLMATGLFWSTAVQAQPPSEQQFFDQLSFDQRSFEIPRKPLGHALYNFARQAGISIARPPLTYRDGKSRRLKGSFTIEEGLRHLLKDTEFGFQIISPKSVRIFKLAPQTNNPTPTEKAIPVAALYMPEIMVSATRRAGLIQKLPYAISSFSGERQVELGSITTNDVTYRVAGIYATNEGVGRNKVIIRGLSDGPFSGRVQSLVSTYLDNTRLTYNAPDPGLMLQDIDRIEVLRGPQGTLYGSGSLGGLYRIVSREPSLLASEFQLSSSVAFTRSGDPSAELSGVMNLPLMNETMAVRMLGYYRRDGGFINDTRLGIDNVNRTGTTGARMSMKIKPDDAWHVILSSSYQLVASDDSNYFNGSLSHLERDNYLREPRHDEFFRLGATIRAEFGWGELVSTSSWLNRKIDRTIDASLAVPFLTGLDKTPSPFTIDRDIETFTNETHLTSAPGDRLEWLLGVFGSHRTETVISRLDIPGASELDFFGTDNTVYLEQLEDRLDEIAVFGELTYYLSQNLLVTGGVRWFHYDDRAHSDLDDIGSIMRLRATGEQKKSGFTPKLLLAYHINSKSMVYAQVAQGYRVGGINLAGLTPVEIQPVDGSPMTPNLPGQSTLLENFDSDELTNFEIGLKNSFLDGRLTVNATGFYAKWDKIQSYQYGFNGLPEVANIGDARILGFEVEGLYRPNHRWEIQANISVSDSKITATTSSFGAEVGSPLPGAPGFSFGLSARRDFSLFALPASLSADYAYVGGADLLFDRRNSPRMDAYHLANMRLSISMDRWQISLYVNNILNTKANIFAFGNPFSLGYVGANIGGVTGEDIIFPGDQPQITNQHTPPRPRVVGLRAIWHF